MKNNPLIYSILGIISYSLITYFMLKPVPVLNDPLDVLNNKIDSIRFEISKHNAKIDSIYNGLNTTYEKIDTSSKPTLRNMLNDFPIRANH